MKIKVGDLVHMSGVGKREYKDYSNNPHSLAGIVFYAGGVFHLDEFSLRVRWSNGKANIYRAMDLEPIKKDYKIEDFL